MKLSLLSEALEAPDNDEDQFDMQHWYEAYIYVSNNSGMAGIDGYTCLAVIDGECLEDGYNSANGVALEAFNEVPHKNIPCRICITRDERELFTLEAESVSELKRKTLARIKRYYPNDYNDNAVDDYEQRGIPDKLTKEMEESLLFIDTVSRSKTSYCSRPTHYANIKTNKALISMGLIDESDDEIHKITLTPKGKEVAAELRKLPRWAGYP